MTAVVTRTCTGTCRWCGDPCTDHDPTCVLDAGHDGPCDCGRDRTPITYATRNNPTCLCTDPTPAALSVPCPARLLSRGDQIILPGVGEARVTHAHIYGQAVLVAYMTETTWIVDSTDLPLDFEVELLHTAAESVPTH